ncbi:MAG: transcriptional regulator [Pelodictyon luteolum]|uniref:Transcriptional regulator, XRE family n=2 Tax=Pelodictyon luteolum TaxID=1100 RepID=Q3B554_CHLL3|nr:helix-turn-helix transcriptional regulator [Pelodictyon luteolum]ABB23527.1 transcriptional regulator, XRE family [Pelodictyon luteolum DSM 273]KZK73878.1 MAG: transcriptional regulator [Pelodictyon luteolum]
MRSDRKRDELQAFIDEQKATRPGFAEGYDEGYRNFRIGVMLKQARLNTGMSQVEVAERLKTHKSAISRIENHAEDVKLSTLVNYAEALGKKLDLLIH